MVRSVVESSTEAVENLTENAPIRVLHVDDDAGFLKAAKCMHAKRLAKSEYITK